MLKIKPYLSIVVTGLVLMLYACNNDKNQPWNSFRGDAGNSGAINTEPVKSLTNLKWKFNTNSESVDIPTADDEQVYFCDENWFLHAVEIESGKEKWSFKLETHQNVPLVTEKVVLYLSDVLYAIDKFTGQEVWRFQLEQKYNVGCFTPVLHNEVIYFTDSEFLYAVNLSSGTEKRRYKANKGIFDMFPAVTANAVYISDQEGVLHAVDHKMGQTLWTAKIGETREKEDGSSTSVVSSNPVVDKGVIYIGTWEPALFAFNEITGRLIWKKELETNTELFIGPSITNNKLFYLSVVGDNKLYACNSSNGNEIWHFNPALKDNESKKTYASIGTSVAKDVVYFGDRSTVYAIDANTGQELWDFKVYEPVTDPIISNGIVFFGCHDGYLYALE